MKRLFGSTECHSVFFLCFAPYESWRFIQPMTLLIKHVCFHRFRPELTSPSAAVSGSSWDSVPLPGPHLSQTTWTIWLHFSVCSVYKWLLNSWLCALAAEQRQILAADERKREFHEEKRNMFESHAEEEQDGRPASTDSSRVHSEHQNTSTVPEQDERTRESTEQWREFHYDGMYPPQEYNRHHIWWRHGIGLIHPCNTMLLYETWENSIKEAATHAKEPFFVFNTWISTTPKHISGTICNTCKPRGFQRVIFSFLFLFLWGSKYREDTNKHPSIKHVFRCDLYIKFVGAQYRYLPHLGSRQHGESLVVGALRSRVLSFPRESQTTENSYRGTPGKTRSPSLVPQSASVGEEEESCC